MKKKNNNNSHNKKILKMKMMEVFNNKINKKIFMENYKFKAILIIKKKKIIYKFLKDDKILP